MSANPIEGQPVTLDDAWFDYNNHLTDWAYGRVLSDVNETVLDRLDLGAAYLARTAHSLFTVDTRIRYLAEVRHGDHLRGRTSLSDVSGKTLRLVTDLVRDDGTVAASAESTYLHVDHATGRTSPFDETTAVRLAAGVADI